MVETVVALLLFLNGNMVEHVYKDNLAQCNESKKIAESVVNTRNVTFVCKEVKAKTIIDDTNKQKKLLKSLTIIFSQALDQDFLFQMKVI